MLQATKIQWAAIANINGRPVYLNISNRFAHGLLSWSYYTGGGKLIRPYYVGYNTTNVVQNVTKYVQNYKHFVIFDYSFMTSSFLLEISANFQ